MLLNIYSIFDSAAEAYTKPFYMHNDGLAIRAFQDNVNSEDQNNISNHPDQFTLFKIGTYDDKTGEITNLENKSLGNGLEYKNPPEDSQLLKKIKALINTVNHGENN